MGKERCFYTSKTTKKCEFPWFPHAFEELSQSVELSLSAVLSQAAPVQWCGPDGSVVLIRAVRSGLDRVVLELLRAGVPVNNTDHTGTSTSVLFCCMWNESLQSLQEQFCFFCSWGVMCFALSGFVFVTLSVLSLTPHCRPSPPASLAPAPLIDTSDSEQS